MNESKRVNSHYPQHQRCFGTRTERAGSRLSEMDTFQVYKQATKNREGNQMATGSYIHFAQFLTFTDYAIP